MKIQQNAVNILERTSAYLKSGVLTKQPAWYSVVLQTPPLKKFERVPKFVNPATNKRAGQLKELDSDLSLDKNGTRLFKSRYDKLDKSSSIKHIYKPAKLQYIEDQLREVFYQQHPWELSRPKIVVENEGDETYDWSNIQQIGKALDGENVVQRALYLLSENVHQDIAKAYDQARYEFYRVRMQNETEEQVAQEESEMFGSIFGPSAIEYGIEQEQKFIDIWKKKAIEETEILEAKRTNPSESWNTNETKENESEEILEDEQKTN